MELPRHTAYLQVKEISDRLGIPLREKWAKGSTTFWNDELRRLMPAEPPPQVVRRRKVVKRRKVVGKSKPLTTYQTYEYQILKPEVVPVSVPEVRTAVRKEMPTSTTSRNIFHMLYDKKKGALPTYQRAEYQILKPEAVSAPEVRTAASKEMPTPTYDNLYDMYSAKLKTASKRNIRLRNVIKTGEKVADEEAYILEKHLRAEIEKLGPKALSRLNRLDLHDDVGRYPDANTVLRIVFRVFMEEARKADSK